MIHRTGKSQSSSKIEKEVISLIRQTYPLINIQTNVRTILSGGGEIDIYLPDFKIGIEVNGDLWHSDASVDYNYGMNSKDYHEEKRELAAREGVELHFVWEYHWRMKNKKIIQELVEITNPKKSFGLLNMTVGPRNGDFTLEDVFDAEEKREIMVKNSILDGITPAVSTLMAIYLIPAILTADNWWVKPSMSKAYDAGVSMSEDDVVKSIRELIQTERLGRRNDLRGNWLTLNPSYLTNDLREERLSEGAFRVG